MRKPLKRWNVKADEKKKSAEPKIPVGKKVQREIIAWFWVGLAFLLINGTIGQARVIPSGSMENTLLIGDHLIMSRIGYDAGVPFTNWHVPLWRNPKRQQVIIFKPPFAPDTPDYVKRVIGLPGDSIDIHDGAVWVNGKKLVEKYTNGASEPLRQPLLGLRPAKRHHRNARDDLYVAGLAARRMGFGQDSGTVFCLCECHSASPHRALE